MLAYVLTGNGGASGVLNGTSFSFSKDHFNHSKLIEALKNKDEKSLSKYLDATQSISQHSPSNGGKIEIINDVVYYDGAPLHSVLTQKMIQILREGFDIQPLVNFLEKLMQNPSKRAIDELYNFLQHKNLGICEDGDFLAYKCVKDNYLDKHSGKFDNTPGAVMEMARNNVCDNANVACSTGFHAGSLEYSGPGGTFFATGDKVVIVKINPKDVISIPIDSNCQKLRCCRYVVLDDFRSPLTRSVYSGKGVKDAGYDSTEYYHDEDEVDDEVELYLEVDDIEENDILSFDYVSHGVNKRRHIEVTEIKWDQRLIIGQLVHPEPAVGQYRSFNLDEMENVILESN